MAELPGLLAPTEAKFLPRSAPELRSRFAPLPAVAREEATTNIPSALQAILPQEITRPSGPSFWENLWRGLQIGLSPQMSPELQPFYRQLLAQAWEKQRQGKHAAEVDLYTRTLEQALVTGEPETITAAMTQIGKALEGSEPETVKALSDVRLKLADTLGELRRRQQLGGAFQEGQTDEEFVRQYLAKGGKLENLDEFLRVRATHAKTMREQGEIRAIQQEIEAHPDLLPQDKQILSALAPRDPNAVVQFLNAVRQGRTAFTGRPLREKVSAALSVPAGKVVPPELASDLARFGIDASDKEQLKLAQKEMAEPTIAVQLAQLGLSREQAEFGRIKPFIDQLTDAQASFTQLGRIAGLFEQTPAFKTGKLGAILRGAFATNRTARFLNELNLLPVGKLTGAEQAFASAYNALIIKLRSFSGDPRFSDEDATRTLQGLGDGLLGRQFPAQLRAAQVFIAELHNTKLDTLELLGAKTKAISRLTVPLTKDEMMDLMIEFGGDRDKARAAAKQRGRTF